MFTLSIKQRLASFLEALVIDLCPAISLRPRCGEYRAN
jgi:hypothetical protein